MGMGPIIFAKQDYAMKKIYVGKRWKGVDEVQHLSILES